MDRRTFLKMLFEKCDENREEVEKNSDHPQEIKNSLPANIKRFKILQMGKCRIKCPEEKREEKKFGINSLSIRNKSMTFSGKKKKQIQSQTHKKCQETKYISNNFQCLFKDEDNFKKEEKNVVFFKNMSQYQKTFCQKEQVTNKISTTLSAEIIGRTKKFSQITSSVSHQKRIAPIINFNSTNIMSNSPLKNSKQPFIKKNNKTNPQKKHQKCRNTKYQNQIIKDIEHPPPKLTAKAYIISEFQNSKQKIHLCFQSKSMFQIASLTKIMTCIVIIEFCQKHKINMNEQFVRIGKFQSNICGTSAGLQNGEILSLQQLLYGLMLPSGNDASLAISAYGGRLMMINDQYKNEFKKQKVSVGQYIKTHAEILSQFKKTKKIYYYRFIQQMNQKGRQLGMHKTSYANPHGLVNRINRSCAYDLSILCEYAMKNKKFSEIVSTKLYKTVIKYCQEQQKIKVKSLKKEKKKQQHQLYSESEEDNEGEECLSQKANEVQNYEIIKQGNFKQRMIQWENTHKLLYHPSNEYVGIKTGVTNAAGSCLASFIIAPNKQKFIIIVLGCQKMSLRFKQTQALKKWLFIKQGIVGNPKDEQINDKNPINNINTNECI